MLHKVRLILEDIVGEAIENLECFKQSFALIMVIETIELVGEEANAVETMIIIS